MQIVAPDQILHRCSFRSPRRAVGQDSPRQAVFHIFGKAGVVKVAVGDGGMESLEELITRELKEAFDEFDKVRSLLSANVETSPIHSHSLQTIFKTQLRASISTRIREPTIHFVGLSCCHLL